MDGDEADEENADVYYYSKEDKKYKVFNAKEKNWREQDSKPTEE